MKKALILSLIIGLCLGFPACKNVKKAGEDAKELIGLKDYKGAMESLLELNRNTLLENDSLMFLLSVAYYGTQNKNFKTVGINETVDMALSPDGKHLLLADMAESRLLLFSLPSLERENTIITPAQPTSLDFSPDGKTFACGMSDGSILIYESASGIPVKELMGHKSNVRGIAYLDGKKLATAGKGQNIIVWNLEDGSELDKTKAHTKNIRTLRYNKDNRILTSCSNEGTAKIWKVGENGKLTEQKRIKHSGSNVNDAGLSPNGKNIVTVSADGSVKIWGVNGTLFKTITLNDKGYSLDFSPSGNLAMVGGENNVYIIDLEDQKIVSRFPTRGNEIHAVKWIDNDTFSFVDNDRLYIEEYLVGQDLIDAAMNKLD